MRLDLFLVAKSYAETRSKASQLIKSGKIKINNKIVTKNGYEITDKDNIEMLENNVLEFVSRGGHKLAKALDVFNIDLKDKIICDIGSSTGGFTDCSLKNGAKKVYAIDVGTSQLHETLRDNTKVVVMENTNFKIVTPSYFNEKIDYYVCDVSFISIRAIIDTLINFKEDFNLICLFKPQFEVGRAKLNNNGVVKKKEYLSEALSSFVYYIKKNNLHILGSSYSPILGNKEGNIEFLFYISTQGKDIQIDTNLLIEDAYKHLKIVTKQ